MWGKCFVESWLLEYLSQTKLAPKWRVPLERLISSKSGQRKMALCCRVLEKELADLISSGEVQARIDSHAKVLYARLTDARANAYDNALKFGAIPPLGNH